MHDDDTLTAWLAQAWDSHDQDPAALADALQARAPRLPDGADGAELVRLARHVMLAHLADGDRLQAFIHALPDHAGLQQARARAGWALATWQERTPALALADEVAWSLLGDVLQARCRVGRASEVLALLTAREAQACDHPVPAARRAFAANCNNTAQALRLGPRGDAQGDAAMIALAQLARRAWQAAGGWLEVERADYQLALCHAAAGQGEPALRHAQACLDACASQGADAMERFFAHECAVHAARSAGRPAEQLAHRQAMQALLSQIDEPSTQAWCAEVLAGLPS
ncbi:hypothetical protein [Ideonella oryzae]|uniref:Uncharacterized protein n=1 Tax=Ideonella oryzae TaxID=2937441 RepID=A0ABT1BMY1_9BURK|nr:hypothetical protein [Ideonella oryzae]MCO5977585.1 hypothetical protein [Ideonella oryzae]